MATAPFGAIHWVVPLVVFDLDGTLVDSRQDLADSVNLLLGDRGLPLLPQPAIVAMVGEGARVLVERALAAAGAPLDEVPSALRRFLEIYDTRLLEHTRAYDGVPEMLDRLASKVAMAVLTNKPTAASVRILEGLTLRRYFKEVIGGDSGVYPRKPDPAALAGLMRTSGNAPASTLMVGDSRIDLDTARNAGVRCCLVRYGFGFPLGAADVGEADVGKDVIAVDHPLAVVDLVERVGLLV